MNFVQDAERMVEGGQQGGMQQGTQGGAAPQQQQSSGGGFASQAMDGPSHVPAHRPRRG
jgi:hypothetical protein